MEEDHSFLFLKKNLMKIFFFFFFGKEKNLSTRHAYQWSDGLILDVLPRGPLKLNFGRVSQRSDGLEGIIHADVCGPFTLVLAK